MAKHCKPTHKHQQKRNVKKQIERNTAFAETVNMYFSVAFE